MESRIEITVIKENDPFNAEIVRAITDKAIGARNIDETEIAKEIIEQIKFLIIETAKECHSSIVINTSKIGFPDEFNNTRIKNKVLDYFKNAGFKEIKIYDDRYYGHTYLDMKW